MITGQPCFYHRICLHAPCFTLFGVAMHSTQNIREGGREGGSEGGGGTVPIDRILSVKNARAWVSIDLI